MIKYDVNPKIPLWRGALKEALTAVSFLIT
jgi:hypothetical protein